MRHRTLIPTALTLALAGAAFAAQAQQIPDPIKLVVGYPAGGTADAVARVYAEELRQRLDVDVLVENRPGAGGQVAAQGFLRAPTDGSELLVANNHMMTTLPLTMKSVVYDPLEDFEPLAVIATFEHVLAVGKNTPADTLDEYVALVKAQPEKFGHYGIPAAGSAPQFVGWSVADRNGLDLTPVPYRGGAPLLTDLLGGHVPAAVDAIGGLPEYAAKGEVKMLAVTGSERLDIIPDVPTFDELGYPGLDASGWMGIYAAKGTDSALVQRLSEAFNEAAQADAIASAVAPIGFIAEGGSGADLTAMVEKDLATWGPLVEASGYELQ